MLILITGPDDPDPDPISGKSRPGPSRDAGEGRAVRELNEAALLLLGRGHMPLVSPALARPILACAREGTAEEARVTLAERLASHCDACLRLGGGSARADAEIALFEQAGKPVYHEVDQVPEETG